VKEKQSERKYLSQRKIGKVQSTQLLLREKEKKNSNCYYELFIYLPRSHRKNISLTLKF